MFKFILVALALVCVSETQSYAAPSAVSTRIAYSTTNISNASWTTLTTLTRAIKSVSVYDSSQKPMQIALGAIGSEVVNMNVGPSGPGPTHVIYPLVASAGTRISIRATSSIANYGENDMVFFYY